MFVWVFVKRGRVSVSVGLFGEKAGCLSDIGRSK